MLTDRNRTTEAPQPGAPRPLAVVIGSGFGGLAAAIRLGARGYRVIVLERLDYPGGRAGVLRQDGFTFDRGPTIVTAPFLFDELWALCGKRRADHVELQGHGPVLSHPVRRRRRDRLLGRRCGDATRGAADFARRSRRLRAFSRQGQGDLPDRLRAARRPALQLAARHAEDRAGSLRLEGYRSVHGLVSRFVKNPKLRVMLQLPPAADRRQPVPRAGDLLPDSGSRAPMGRALPDGRRRQAGARAGRARRGAGRQRALQCRCRAHRRRQGPRPRRRAGRRRA